MARNSPRCHECIETPHQPSAHDPCDALQCKCDPFSSPQASEPIARDNGTNCAMYARCAMSSKASTSSAVTQCTTHQANSNESSSPRCVTWSSPCSTKGPGIWGCAPEPDRLSARSYLTGCDKNASAVCLIDLRCLPRAYSAYYV
ncbi:hypothetical protein T440DRAFT_23568 [Plenodomus tracheiphilus IPT5]|uniref:Uncharacterized protein n=1 Tax=Plenodomus tracheiphilus IPT5 TaxID=1408161 RepID=A0A6A7BCE4_9PLEO|nr:hypothetical protein T440DRAFT_23568 [Plenodomus tracheiphilus IPT5]